MITPKTIARFLVGKRDAIEEVATSKGLLPDGLTIKSRPDGSIYFGSNHP
jgi:hypothetical protein